MVVEGQKSSAIQGKFSHLSCTECRVHTCTLSESSCVRLTLYDNGCKLSLSISHCADKYIRTYVRMLIALVKVFVVPGLNPILHTSYLYK